MSNNEVLETASDFENTSGAEKIKYEVEVLGEDEDDGTMPANVNELADSVVGHRIIKVETVPYYPYPGLNHTLERLEITLDTGRVVTLEDSSDCCAFTELRSFIYNADKVDHIITGVGTTDNFETWHIYADMGDVLKLHIGWSSGNPFYYGYGFEITIKDIEKEPANV